MTHNAMDIWEDEDVAIEIVVDHEDPFVHIPKMLATDKELSHKARGALLYIIGDGRIRNTNREGLRETLGFSKKAMREFFRELEQAGYMTKEKIPPRPGIPRFTYRYSISRNKNHQFGQTVDSQPAEIEDEETPVQTRCQFWVPRGQDEKSSQFRLGDHFGYLDPNNNISSNNDTNTSKISQSDNKDESSIEKPTNQQAQPKSQTEEMVKDKSKRERLQDLLNEAMTHEYRYCSEEQAEKATDELMPIFLNTKRKQDMKHQRILIKPKIDELYGYAHECLQEYPDTEKQLGQAVMDAIRSFRGRNEQDVLASCWVDDHMELIKEYIHENIRLGQECSWSRWSRR